MGSEACYIQYYKLYFDNQNFNNKNVIMTIILI